MESGSSVALVLAAAAGIGMAVLEKRMAEPPDPQYQWSEPENLPLAGLDDNALRQKFLEGARALNYRSQHYGVSTAEAEVVRPLATAQRELARRGEREWERLKAFRKLPRPEGMSDAKLLQLLYGMPESWDDKDARLYEPVMREILQRGGEWNRISADWRWVGFEGLSDNALKDLWNAATHAHTVNTVRQRERVLSEVVHRGGDTWKQFLQEQVNVRAATTAPYEIIERPGADLEILTALRRVEKKPDPVAVRIDEPLEEVVVFPALPKWNVALVNQDASGTPVGYEVGGDYRSGRSARWRVTAIDERGNEMPESKAHGFMGGGLFNFGVLGPKDQWTTSLDGASYLPALPPGKYTLQILYHDEVTISDEASIKGLIYSSSPEIHLTVRPMIVHLAVGEGEAIRKEVLAIQDEPLKFVYGSYGSWAYDFVPPDSEQGKVLVRGQKAVPVLLSMLDDKSLTPRQRAEILAMLCTLTGQNSPLEDFRGSNVLGSFVYHEGPWVIAGQGQVMGIGAGGSGEDSGRVDVQKQREFAKRWESWKQAIKTQ